MPRKQGIGRKYKKSRLTVTEEPTLEVEGQLEEGDEEEEPELDDEVIDDRRGGDQHGDGHGDREVD